MDPAPTGRLKFLHAEDTLSAVKLRLFRERPTEWIILTPQPGQLGSLKVRLDGKVLDGHHRLAILLERGDALSQRYWEKAMAPNIFWIPGPWRGRLAIVTRPRGGDWVEDELKSWRHAGFDVVVSLLETGEAAQLGLLDEGQAALASGLGYRSFPIPDRGVPSSMPAFESLVSDLSTELDQGKNVALHCRQGIGRSALVAGWNPDKLRHLS